LKPYLTLEGKAIMNNNDILRRIRFIFDFNDTKMMELFTLGGEEASRAEISDWLKKDEDPDFKGIYDKQLAVFLSGLIIKKRGKKDGIQPPPEKKLNNNIVFRKLKIALNLKDTDILEILELAEMRISKHELSAFFRNPDQSQFRPCKDQVLRNFLQGLQIKLKRIPENSENP
jgi:uncharacterized protein YehS (DUF1456 family)